MPLSFDTSGLVQANDTTWQDPATGDVVQMVYYDMVPNLPAALDDVAALRARLAEHHAAEGGLISAEVTTLDDAPVLTQVQKLPMPNAPAGLVFSASIIVPKAESSATLTILCPERGTTGTREATVGASVGLDGMYPPHPYAPQVQARLPYNVADEPQWDTQFPEHPLTRARAWLAHTLRTAHLSPAFAGQPPFRGPAE